MLLVYRFLDKTRRARVHWIPSEILLYIHIYFANTCRSRRVANHVAMAFMQSYCFYYTHRIIPCFCVQCSDSPGGSSLARYISFYPASLFGFFSVYTYKYMKFFFIPEKEVNFTNINIHSSYIVLMKYLYVYIYYIYTNIQLRMCNTLDQIRIRIT